MISSDAIGRFFLPNSQHSPTTTTFQQPPFNSPGENKASYVHIRSRTPLNYLALLNCCCNSTCISMRLRRPDLPAAADQSEHVRPPCMISPDVIGRFFLSNSQPSAEFILSNNLHSIPPTKTNDVPKYKTPKLPGYPTIWYQERRDTPRRRV